MRRANRKDKVHAPIVEGLRKHGYAVYDMPDPGDVLVYGWHRWAGNQWMPMELKSGNNIRKKKADGSDERTPRQKQLLAKGGNAEIPIVHTLAEALALFGIEEAQ